MAPVVIEELKEEDEEETNKDDLGNPIDEFLPKYRAERKSKDETSILKKTFGKIFKNKDKK